jgi:DNA-binding CsgD family transcriptional regulator
MPTFTQASRLLRFIRAVGDRHTLTPAGFGTMLREYVQPLLPHGACAAFVAQPHQGRLAVSKGYAFGYAAGPSANLLPVLLLHERALFASWLHRREPYVVEPEQRHPLLDSEAQAEAHRLSLGRFAIHGQGDLASSAGSYFSFARLQVDWSERRIASVLQAIVPHLHAALGRVHEDAAPTWAAPTLPAMLTPTEAQLLALVAQGHSNADIARLRNRSEATVRNQLHSAYAKLGVGSRLEAVQKMQGWTQTRP